jgi:hypothetical protein
MRAWRISFVAAAAVFIGASTFWWVTQDPGPPSNRPPRPVTSSDLILYP